MMLDKIWNYFFFNPTHVIKGYPIDRLNGIKCEVEGNIDHYFKSMELVYIQLEKRVPRAGGKKAKFIMLNKKYVHKLTIP